MKLSEEYTEIVGVTHRGGEEECHDLMPKVAQLEAGNKSLREDVEEYENEILIMGAELDNEKAENEALMEKVQEAYILGALDYCRKESLVRADIDLPDDLLTGEQDER